MITRVFWNNEHFFPDMLMKSQYKVPPRVKCPGLDHIFIRLGPVPSTPPSLSGLPVCTCMGTRPRWEPMWQYPVKITNIQDDITFAIPELMSKEFLHTPKELNDLRDRILSYWFPTGKSSHTCVGRKIGQWRRREKGGTQPNERCDLAQGVLNQVNIVHPHIV